VKPGVATLDRETTDEEEEARQVDDTTRSGRAPHPRNARP